MYSLGRGGLFSSSRREMEEKYLEKYLEIRGIKPSIYYFLWLKNVNKFVEA